MEDIRRNRVEEAQAWAFEHGWAPLTEEDRVEFRQAITDCTNL